jgi:WhiB family redox-sensing transcriptional regulator
MQDWRRFANCLDTDPELFFPPDGAHGDVVKRAKAVCADCDVRMRCLQFALETPFREDHGILGGATVAERRLMRKGIA